MYRGGPYGIAGGGVWEQFPYANMHEWNIDFILRKLKTLEGRMALLDERMNSLEADMTTLQEQMRQLREAMAALILKVEALETGREAAVNRIAALEAGLDRVQGALDALTERVITLEAAVIDINNNIALIREDITALSGRLDSVESDLSFQLLTDKCSQNGAVGRMGRQVYQMANVVRGILSFRDGWTGDQESLVIDVDGLSLPGHGMYYLYRCQLPGYILETQPFMCGWFNSLNPEPKRGKDYDLT